MARFLSRALRHHQHTRPDHVVNEPLKPSDKSLAVKIIQSSGSKGVQEARQELSDPDTGCSDSSNDIHTKSEDVGAHGGLSKFDAVMGQAEIKRAAQLATRIRVQDAKLAQSGTLGRLQKLRFSCKVIGSPDYGSYNILFPIRFLDGVQWLLKIPANGSYDRWDEQSAQALTSEVLTMKLIRNNSSIPVPRIYGFDATTANELKCPYILMERIDGVNLFHGWFYNNSSIGQDRFREEAVANIAKAMVQLNAFTFPKAGTLQYNSTAKAFDIGPYRKVNHYVAPEAATCYSQQGPFLNPKDYFRASLNQLDTKTVLHTLQGQCKLLRLFIEWFFQVTSMSEDMSGFVLTHPDFALQNIIMGEDGSLRGFVDWDGVVAVPRCIGCEEYPLWLTSDWDPSYWNYDTEHDCVIAEPAMSPAELYQYRTLYAQAVDNTLRENSLQGTPSSLSPDTQFLQREQHQSSRTRASCLARCLYISANEPKALPYNVDMILEKITDLTTGERFNDPLPDAYGNIGMDHGTHATERTKDPPDGLKHAVDDVENKTEQHMPSAEVDERCSSGNFQANEIILSALPDNKDTPDYDDPSPVTAKENIELTVVWTLPETMQMACLQDDLCYHNTTVEHWRENLSMWISMMFLTLLSIPVFFTLLMDWLHSFDTLPIGMAFAGILLSNSSKLATLAALLLGGLLFARLLDTGVASRITKVTHSSTDRKTMKPPHDAISREYESVLNSSRVSRTLAPSEQLRETSLDDKDMDCQYTAADSARFQSSMAPSGINDISQRISTTGDGYPDLVLQPAQDDSDSGDNSSGKSDDTSITVPSLGSDSYQGVNTAPRRQYLGPGDEDLLALTFEERLERIKQIWREDPTWDFGLFSDRDIYSALYKGNLDAARMRRLKVGFQRLLASLDDRFADFDGLTFSDG